MQNPNSPHSLKGGGAKGAARQRFYTRPFFVAPVTAAITAAAIYLPSWIDGQYPPPTPLSRQVISNPPSSNSPMSNSPISNPPISQGRVSPSLNSYGASTFRGPPEPTSNDLAAGTYTDSHFARDTTFAPSRRTDQPNQNFNGGFLLQSSPVAEPSSPTVAQRSEPLSAQPLRSSLPQAQPVPTQRATELPRTTIPDHVWRNIAEAEALLNDAEATQPPTMEAQ